MKDWIFREINQWVWLNLGFLRSYIGIQLTNEAGEIVVFEVFGEKGTWKLRRVPHDEAIVRWAPRDDRVARRIFHHVVGLAEEWRRWSVGVKQRSGMRVSGRRRRGLAGFWVSAGNTIHRLVSERREREEGENDLKRYDISLLNFGKCDCAIGHVSLFSCGLLCLFLYICVRVQEVSV